VAWRSEAGHVWCADVTYLPMARGFCYLVAVMDWASRRVLAWRLSNTLDADFCIEALEEALERYDAPEILNSDQGAQFTCEGFTSVLAGHGVAISMDGRGRWLDNVFIERLWRSVKHEEVYLKAYENLTEARRELGAYFEFHNRRRRHQGLTDRTPDEVCWATLHRQPTAAFVHCATGLIAAADRTEPRCPRGILCAPARAGCARAPGRTGRW